MLSFIRRLFTMLAIVVLIISVTALLVAPRMVGDLALQLEETSSSVRTFMVIAAVLIDLLLISMLYRVIRPRKREELLVRARGAKARVSVDSVQRQINTRIAQVSDVLHVHTDVEVTQGAARVELNVRTRPDIMIPEKQKEISRVLRQLVEKQMGLRLSGEPVIHLALATDEFDTTDHVTTVVESDEEPIMSLPESPTTTYAEMEQEPAVRASLPAPKPVPEPEMQPQEQKEEEPWRAFLLGDNQQ